MDRLPTPVFDAIVVGLGVHGSATLRALALRGQRVLGIDRFAVPHAHGSSHGESRIIRQAYHEHPSYVPFVQRSYELWDELARETNEDFLVRTGGLFVGAPTSRIVSGALESARLHHLPHEVLTPAEVAKRFPQFHLAPNEIAVFEPRASALRLPESQNALLASARRRGAVLQTDERVLSWSATKDEVRVRSDKGEYAARSLVIAAGAWLGRLVPELAPSLRVERQVVGWFRPRGDATSFGPGRCPVFLWDRTPKSEIIYGFPDLGRGVKVGIHHAGETVDPETVSREASTTDADRLRAHVAPAFPQLDVAPHETSVCLYTNTPDEAFILDRHPDHANVVIASCCSGHGYKFAPAVGEAATELALGATPRSDLGLFQIRRLWPKTRASAGKR
jgi:sarcosine oxidase